MVAPLANGLFYRQGSAGKHDQTVCGGLSNGFYRVVIALDHW